MSISLDSMSQLSDEQTTEETWLHQHEIDRLMVNVAQLSPREQELIALKYGAQLTNRKIADIMKLSESNVGTILHRVISQLREQWED